MLTKTEELVQQLTRIVLECHASGSHPFHDTRTWNLVGRIAGIEEDRASQVLEVMLEVIVGACGTVGEDQGRFERMFVLLEVDDGRPPLRLV